MQSKLFLPIATKLMSFTVAFSLLWGIIGVLSGCSREKAEVRSIRGHNHIVEGIAHAEGLNHADRLCQSCHGTALQGGKQNTVPSCYQCHGQNWLASPANKSRAPLDHTVMNDIFMHKEKLNTPKGDCDSCHGANLEGADGAPSCLLCHEKKWLE